MDLQLFLRVIWRFRVLVAFGLVAAIGLAALSVVKTQVRYQSKSTLLVTQSGFPWGRAAEQFVPSGRSAAPATPTGDQTRLTNLASLYSQLANSDQVHAIVAQSGPIDGQITAAPIVPTFSSTGPTLPLLTITAVADSPRAATSLARRESAALQTYLRSHQDDAHIADSNRVLVQVLRQPGGATVAQGPKLTLPIFIFLAVMIPVIGLAFVLENLRPRIRVVSHEPVAAARRALGG